MLRYQLHEQAPKRDTDNSSGAALFRALVQLVHLAVHDIFKVVHLGSLDTIEQVLHTNVNNMDLNSKHRQHSSSVCVYATITHEGGVGLGRALQAGNCKPKVVSGDTAHLAQAVHRKRQRS